MRCPVCATELPAGANFCVECGARQSAGRGGEYRQLTVLFVDLVDSTSLSEQLDPEQLRDVVRAYQADVASAVEGLGGTVAQYLGDGVLVYFGVPTAHEDDPWRAVQAGLHILERQEALNQELERSQGDRLHLRIGAHTGEVVISELGGGGRRERLAVGVTVNVASRLSDQGASDTLVISDDTRKLVASHFECESLGALDLKGISEPMLAYRVIRSRDRSEQRSLEKSPPLLVGREKELISLVDRFESAQRGESRAATIRGEPGIGKTRLLRALRERVGGSETIWLEGHCSHFREASALYPVVDLIEQALELGPLPNPEAKLAQLKERLTGLVGKDSHAVALIATLLSLPSEDSARQATLSPEKLRRETTSAIGELLFSMAARRPVVLVIEDLQWVDPSTLDLLRHLLDAPAGTRLLTLLSSRPGRSFDWGATPMIELELSRLRREPLASIVSLHSGGHPLPIDVMDQILAKADGIPLFAEELTKMVVESDLLERRDGAYRMLAPEVAIAIPSTLQGSLVSRLDRLPLGKPVAQVAAVIGRSFAVELLQKVAELSETDLREGLSQLEAADLVNEIDQGDDEFVFRHALIQDAAYGLLLRRDRQRVHARIAELLESDRPDLVEMHPELIAHHHAQAGNAASAVALWQRAGHNALRKSASPEAIHHFSRALDLLLTLPESEQRRQGELALRLAKGNAYVTSLGYAAEPVEHEFELANELCSQLSDAPGLFAATNGLWGYHLVRGEREIAARLVERQADLASRSERASERMLALHAEGTTAFYEGDFARALPALEEAAALHRELQGERLRQGRKRPWRSPAATAVFYLGWAQHLTGHVDRGEELQLEALRRTESEGDPYAQVEAMTHLVALLHDRREPARTLELSDRIVTTADELGFRFWHAIGISARGWARCHGGEIEDGLEEIEQGLDVYFEQAGSMVPLVYRYSYLAEGLLLAGRHEEGLRVADQALARSAGRLDRFYDAELQRLRGALLLGSGRSDAREQAESVLREAVALAQRQGARLLELRAGTDLARLLAELGRRDEARQLLRPRRAALREGLATADLREADGLLDQLDA